MSRILALLCMLGLLSGCTRDTVPLLEAGNGYFPLETGRYLEYEITETRYALARAPEVLTYRLRETIGEKYTDSRGQDVYRVERAIRIGNIWRPDSIQSAWLTRDRAFRSENGLTIVKLEFPVQLGKTWDGNRYNTLGEHIYEMTELDIPYQVGAQKFDQVLTVVHQNDSTLLSLRRKQEKYAEGIGLIEWKQTNVKFCGTPTCLGKGVIDYGITRTGSITNYGK
jgi:hypothetical protein